MESAKRIALIAHDDRKDALIHWVKTHEHRLKRHQLFATGTTGGRILQACPTLDLTAMKSGPLGGDQQIGAKIAEGGIDMLIFFIDPLSPHPHDVDVRALTRLSTLHEIALATNRATADFLIASPLFDESYAQPAPILRG